jgi:hypothetical protein
VCCHYGVFKVHAGRRPALHETTARPGSTGIGTVSQNSTAYGLLRRGRRCFQANRVIGRASSSTSSAPAGVKALLHP